MSLPTGSDNQGTSTRPYLLRALHEWCTDNGFTPYIAVYVDGSVQVPMEYVKNGEIVLNVGFEATSSLTLGNEAIVFKARFGGLPRDIVVPVDHVVAIYARENGQGMAFPMPADAGTGAPAAPASPGNVPARSPTPLRGLRLASVPAEAPAPPEAPAPASSAAAADAPADAAPAPPSGPEAEDGPAPTDTPPAGGGRPSLKRVK